MSLLPFTRDPMTIGRSGHALANLLVIALAIILALTACATVEQATTANPITGTDRRDCSACNACPQSDASGVSSHDFT